MNVDNDTHSYFIFKLYVTRAGKSIALCAPHNYRKQIQTRPIIEPVKALMLTIIYIKRRSTITEMENTEIKAKFWRVPFMTCSYLTAAARVVCYSRTPQS